MSLPCLEGKMWTHAGGRGVDNVLLGRDVCPAAGVGSPKGEKIGTMVDGAPRLEVVIGRVIGQLIPQRGAMGENDDSETSGLTQVLLILILGERNKHAVAPGGP